MPNYTTNYNLQKPLPEEFYDIAVHNANMDAVDAELKKRAVLDENGKIHIEQFPDDGGYISTTEKGVADGVASLDSTGKVPSSQLPSMDYVPNSQKGAAGGVATLGEDQKVPADQLPEISSVKNHSVILYTYGWNMGDDDRFYQIASVPDVTADTKVVMVDVDLSTDDLDAKVAYLEAWAFPSANEVDQSEGTLTFYAWEQPTVNIPVNVGVM